MEALGPKMTGEVRYEPNERPPFLLSLGLGFQLAVLCVGGIVLTPAIIIRGAGESETYLTWAVFSALCICGVSTILQAVRLGRIGAGYVLLMGTSGVFIAVSISTLQAGGPSLLATLVIASSLCQFVLASRLSLLRKVITPVVGGTVIMLIAVTIVPIAFDMSDNVPEGTSSAAAPMTAGLTLLCTAGLILVGRGTVRLWAPVIGVVVGCVVSSFFGLYDVARVVEAPWFGLPAASWPGLDLEFGPAFWTLLPVFILATVVGAVETVGDAIAIQQVSWRRPRATDFRAVQGAVGADGVGNLLSGLAGTVPNTTYSSTIAVTEITGVAARSVGLCIGVVFLSFAILPKVTAIILAIPEPVVSAYLLVLLAVLFIVGMRIVVQDGLDSRKAVVVGLSFWLGAGFQNQQIFPESLDGILGAVLGNGMAAGGLAVIVMTIVFNLCQPRAWRTTARLARQSLPHIDSFLKTFAGDKRWPDEAAQRLRAAGEEAVLSLTADEPEAEGEEARHLLLILRGDSNAAELEFIASPVGTNLEDRLAILGQWARQSDENDLPLLLLRHYASSVRHRQYHDTDVITIRVSVALPAGGAP